MSAGGTMNKDELLDLLKKLKQEKLAPKERRAISRQIVAASVQLRSELCEALEKEESKSFKIELLNIIGATQDAFFEDEIRKILESPEPAEVIQAAATTLGKLKGKNGFDILIDLIHHENPNVRLGSIYGLMALGDKRAVKYLLENLDDNETVRSWWASPKAGGYTISKEAAIAIDTITGRTFKGDKKKIEEWIKDNLDKPE